MNMEMNFDEVFQELRRECVVKLQELDAIEEEKKEDVIASVVSRKSKELGLSLYVWRELEVRLLNSLSKLDIIEELMEDKDVTEVMINGHNSIFYERNGRVYPYEKSFESEQRLLEIIDQIVGEHNRRVNMRTPIVDTRLRDGSRVHIVLPPISLQGPVMTIRKFKEDIISIKTLVDKRSITDGIACYLEEGVRERKTILITGGTGSGKTTLLNALSEIISSEDRVITIEDSAELKLQKIPNLIRLECRQSTEEGLSAVTIRDLIKASLRMNPDRIVIGEVRGAEALDLLQVLNTGHRGSLSTLHANSCKDSFSRLETMALMAMDLPLYAIRSQIASGIQIIVHLSKTEDGKRVVDEVIEIEGFVNGEITYRTIYQQEE